jgi:putative copper resistance protein D
MLETALAASRFLHYAACATLFGGTFFPIFAPARGAFPLGAQRLAASLAFLSAALWFLFATATMAGSFAQMDGETIRTVLMETAFGRLWLARLLAGAVLLGLLLARNRSDVLVCIVSAVLLASLAGTGHTQEQEGLARIVHIGADAVHLLAASAWLGGLPPLALLLARDDGAAQGREETLTILSRFSAMGIAAVAALVASGLVNSWFLLGPVANLWSTPYGRLLSLKLCLFAGMVGLAALNRFRLMPKLAQREQVMSQLRHHLLAEHALGVLILGLVSVIGTTMPGAG